MSRLALLLTPLFACSTALSAADLSVTASDAGAVVKIGDEIFAEYVTNGEGSNMPYLWPIHGPGGKSMTRAYPMQDIEGEQQDHPHHRGLCFGHESLAGADTWAELASFEKGLASSKEETRARSQARVDHLGTIQHREFSKLASQDGTVTVVALSDHLDREGNKLLEEERTMTFSVDGDSRIIDVDIKLIASEGDVLSADKKDAGISIRLPTSMAVDTGLGGKIVNSEGDTDKDAWSKRAKWCDYHGPVDGETVGVAMLNHPQSLRFPTFWHVRTYGLFTANPFGPKSLVPEEEDGALTIPKGESLSLYHRFIFHPGDEKAAKIEEAWQTYSKIEKP